MLKQHHNIPSSYVFSLDRRETVPLLSDDERKAAAQHSEAEFLRQFHALREARRRAKALAAGAHSVSQTSAGRAASGSPTIAITTSAQAKPVIFVKVTSPVCNEEPSKKPFHLDIVHHTITKETGSIISEYPNLPSIYSSPSRTIHSNSKGKEPERPSHRLELPVPVVGQEQDHASITLTSNTVNNVNLNDLPRVSPVSTSNRAANASSPSIGQAIPTDPVDVNVLEGQETTKNNLDSNEALRRSPPPSSSSSGSVAFVPCSALTKLGNPCRCPGKFPVPPQPPVSSSNALGLNLGGPAPPGANPSSYKIENQGDIGSELRRQTGTSPDLVDPNVVKTEVEQAQIPSSSSLLPWPLHCFQHARAKGYLPPETLIRKCSEHLTITECNHAKAVSDALSGWLPATLDCETRRRLTREATRPPFDSDYRGYVYAVEIREPTSTPTTTYTIKIGYSTNVYTNIVVNWQKTHRSKKVTLRGCWPGGLVLDADRMDGLTLKEDITKSKKCRFSAKLARLIQIELSPLETLSKECTDCQKTHCNMYIFEETPELGDQSWEGTIVPVIERWCRYVNECMKYE